MSVSDQRSGLRLRGKEIKFVFDGRTYSGIEGDSVASALLANGVQLFGRSVKYRRRRGVLAAGVDEPNALLTVGTDPYLVPNMAASRVLIRDGLQLASQNRWPTLEHDVIGGLLGLGSGFYGAGFYYKTFIWPSWHAWEGIIRRLAGLGKAPGASELAPAGRQYLACDVVIAGAGPAGLTAALTAARAGASVIICEREVNCGGELDFETATIDGLPSREWSAKALQELEQLSVRVLTETSVISSAGGLVVAHREPGGLPGKDMLYHIQTAACVLATGAQERFIAFANNDLPGVMLLGAAERYLARYGVRVGQRLVLFGNHDRLYAAATRLRAAGMQIVAIIDTRDHSGSSERAELLLSGTECLSGHAVVAVQGRRKVTSAIVAPLATSDSRRELHCDALLVSGGWHSSATKAPDESALEPQWQLSCGAANGQLELARVIEDGCATGARVSQRSAEDTSASAAIYHAFAIEARGDAEPLVESFWRSAASKSEEKRQFVDLQNDVTVADLRQALAEGLQDIEHVKRFTTLGVGTDQGRTGGLLGAAILGELRNIDIEEARPSRPRRPYQPVSLSALAGWRRDANRRPTRRAPLHEWHAANGAELEVAGLWLRPRFYHSNGSTALIAGTVEAARVRQSGGIADASTLGKIEVAGSDAAAFLDHLYLSRASTLKAGRAKYAVLLREDGMVLDDGLMLRRNDQHFFITTSTGHANAVLEHLEFCRAAQWGSRHVALTDVTDAWAVIVVAGPTSRATLCDILGSDCLESIEDCSHMQFKDGQWQEQELRMLRASFSGELAYELYCRPCTAPTLWQKLIDAGLQPYGLEALDILRIEKGYLTAAELNGQTTPHDLGLDRLATLNEGCIGHALLDRPGLHAKDRPCLVGLRASDATTPFLPGAQLTTIASHATSLGHVTSTARSPTLNAWIGLALVARSHATEGTELVARDPVRSQETRVIVVGTTHLDAGGERIKS